MKPEFAEHLDDAVDVVGYHVELDDGLMLLFAEQSPRGLIGLDSFVVTDDRAAALGQLIGWAVDLDLRGDAQTGFVDRFRDEVLEYIDGLYAVER